MQLLLTSVQGLWIYNYIITLGDEVYWVFFYPIEAPDFDRSTDKICLVWEEVLG